MKLRIGHYDWDYEEVKKIDETDLLGRCSYPKCEIKLRRGMDSVPRRVTILHEICHAMFDSVGYKFETNRESENVVDILSNGLIQIIDDNPRFFREKIIKK